MNRIQVIRGYCAPCGYNSTFRDYACARCGDRPDGIPDWRDDEPLPDSDYAAYHATPQSRPKVNWRPLMSSRHVKDFYAEGHEVFQVGTKNKRDRIVYSRGEEQRLLEKHGLSPEDGMTPLKDDDGNDIF